MKIFETLSLWTILFLLVWFENNVTGVEEDKVNDPTTFHQEDVPHSRQKRLLWITTDGRLALPPGTTLTISPSLSLPFVRYPPDGFKSDMSISLPFTINFDTLGLTDNQNPFGSFPQLLTKTTGRQVRSTITDYVAHLIRGRRSTRSAPTLPKPIHSYFQGGERALLYTVVEDILANFGMDGKACLLRTICEVHGHKAIHKFGFLGELLHLFLTASRSNFAELLHEYVTAETVGKHREECYPYFKKCPKSLFTNDHNYSENDSSAEDEDDLTMPNFDFDDLDGGNGINGTNSRKKPDGPKFMVKPAPLAM